MINELLEQIYEVKGKNLREVFENIQRVGYKNAKETADKEEFENYTSKLRELEQILSDIDKAEINDKLLFSVLLSTIVAGVKVDKELLLKFIAAIKESE